MINKENSTLQSLIVHHVGSKLNEESIRLSKSELVIDDGLEELLLTFFLSPFKSEEYFNLSGDGDGTKNQVYASVSKIFDNPETLYDESVALANRLYYQSTYPKAKGGEFYVVYLEVEVSSGEYCEVVGLFFSENKTTFLKVFPKGDNYSITSDEGVNINKIDKGCLIFNMEKDKGYLVSMIDNTIKGNDPHYWADDFLGVSPRKDDFYKTQNMLSLCKSFVADKLVEEYEVSKADQADLLNKSVKFFKSKESFDLDEFATEVIQQPEIIESFKKYKNEFQREWDLDVPDSFDISGDAVKKQARVFKSVIKLDKNFHIYVHGKRDFIIKGFDKSTGMHFYQLFFEEEN